LGGRASGFAAAGRAETPKIAINASLSAIEIIFITLD
jgi:hypothetical protein